MLVIKSKEQYFIDKGEQEWTNDITEASIYENEDFTKIVSLIDGFQEYRVEIVNEFGIVIYCNEDVLDRINVFLEQF